MEENFMDNIFDDDIYQNCFEQDYWDEIDGDDLTVSDIEDDILSEDEFLNEDEEDDGGWFHSYGDED